MNKKNNEYVPEDGDNDMVDVNSFNDSWDSFESPALPDLTKRVSKLVTN